MPRPPDLMTASQAFINHWGIRLTSRLVDLSGYLIIVVAFVLTGACVTDPSTAAGYGAYEFAAAAFSGAHACPLCSG